MPDGSLYSQAARRRRRLNEYPILTGQQPAWLDRGEAALVAAWPGRTEADKLGEGRHAFLVGSLFVCADIARDLPECRRE